MPYQSFARARRFGRQLVGPAVGVYLAGLTAAAALAALLWLAPLVVELLATRGALTVPIEQSPAVDALGVKPASSDGATVHYAGCGLLPTVWRTRDSWTGPAFGGLYAALPALRSNQSCLAFLAGAIWLLGIAAAAALYWLQWAVYTSAVATGSALRRQVHAQVHRLGAADMLTGETQTSADLFVDQTSAIQRGLVAWWRAFPHAAAFAILLAILALSVDFWVALAVVLLAVLAWRLFQEFRRRQQRRLALALDREDKLTALLLDNLSQNQVLGNLPLEDRVDAELFDENLRRFNASILGRDIPAAANGPLILLLALLVAGLVLLLAGFNVLRDPPRLSIAQVALLAWSLAAGVYPLFRFERVLERLPAANEAARDVFAYLDRQSTVGQIADAAPLEKLSRQVALDHVTMLNTAGIPLLDDVTFSLAAEERVVIFWSGNTTPVSLAGALARFCDPSAGRVLFDGRDLRHATLDSVRRQVMVILADHVLVSGTLAENIVGDDRRISSDEIIEALKLVHAYEFVQPLSEGLETIVGPHALTLSPGQAMRLALARVALRQPSVVVIEEPREELDQVTAERVTEALEQVVRGRALVVLARRLPTLRAARRILLFHDGRLVADGTHQGLLQTSELYRHLNYVRFNEFRDTVQ